MRLIELRIDRLRLLSGFELTLPPGWTAFVGSNGAGKTSILEAVFMLSHGRSFRGGVRDSLTQMGSAGFSVFGRIAGPDGVERRLGLARNAGRMEARVDGAEVAIGGLVQASAVVCFEPGSHELISGGSDERRRFLDWGVFHVEHDFLRCWRRYQRALRQRNALLREVGTLDELEPWERELGESGELLSSMRKLYMDTLRPALFTILAELLPELGAPELTFDRGWRHGVALADTLLDARTRDRERGHTTRGPHRADWSIAFERAPRREHLSRGQQKVCALAFVLAQARLFADGRGEWPILCFDDLASELDLTHQDHVIEVARRSGAQVLLTGTDIPISLRSGVGQPTVFHVEHGRLQA